MTSIDSLAARLLSHRTLVDRFDLDLGDCRIHVATDNAALAERLRFYFRHLVADGTGEADMAVTAIEMDAPDLGLEFVDWAREPGKSGRKEAFADIDGGRVVLKVRTGMQFLLGAHERLAFGPCMANDNQIINFINAQYIMWLLHQGYVLCHAAGLVHGGKGVGIAAGSGGGKSTLMLNLISRGADFCTNDRLLARRDEVEGEASTRLAGIPKLPRINPGTVRFNPDLHPVMDAGRLAEVMAMPQAELWDLEEKYDVDIIETYGEGRIQMAGTLDAFCVLNWSREGSEPVKLTRIDLRERSELLGAIAKSAGPFYAPPGGNPPRGQLPVEFDPYYAHLADVPLYEVTGTVDFDAAATQILELLQ